MRDWELRDFAQCPWRSAPAALIGGARKTALSRDCAALPQAAVNRV